MKAKFQISPFRSMMFVILTPQFKWCFKYKHHGNILVFESNSTFFSGIWLKFWNLEALIWAESGVIPKKSDQDYFYGPPHLCPGCRTETPWRSRSSQRCSEPSVWSIIIIHPGNLSCDCKLRSREVSSMNDYCGLVTTSAMYQLTHKTSRTYINWKEEKSIRG